jgi:hypothetical protein
LLWLVSLLPALQLPRGARTFAERFVLDCNLGKAIAYPDDARSGYPNLLSTSVFPLTENPATTPGLLSTLYGNGGEFDAKWLVFR